MSTKAEMVTLLGGLFGERLFADVAPDKTQLPYATWAQVGGPAITFFEGANTSKRAGRIQFNIWANTAWEADTLANALADIVVATPINGEPQGAPRSAYSQPPNMRGMQQDFIIWFDQ